MEVAVFNPSDLSKTKAAAQGELRTRADGRTYKKTGKKWIVQAAFRKPRTTKHVEADAWRKGLLYYEYAMTSNLGGVVDDALQKMGIADYDALVKKIKTGSIDTAHKIYKQVVDSVTATGELVEDRQAVLHLIGQTLVTLHKHYTTRMKATATVRVTSKKGKEYYKYKETPELPTLKASAIAKAKKKMSGWSVTGELESKHVRAMLKTKTAKLISGKIDSKKKWHMPEKAADLELTYKGKALLIHVKQIRKTPQKTKATAKAEIKVPYEFAKAFLQAHIKSVRTRDNFIFRMERSAGYRSFLERAVA